MTDKQQAQMQEERQTVERIDAEVEEAIEIEKQNYLLTREARINLEKSLLVQESTANELLKDDETINHIKGTVVKVLDNSKASCEIQIRIKEESKLLYSFDNVVNRVKRWWKRDTKKEQEIETIKSRMSDNTSSSKIVVIPHENSTKPIAPADDTLAKTELVPGENKTNTELTAIRDALKKVNSNARFVIKKCKEQGKDLNDITKIGGFSCDIVNETEEAMNRK